MARAATAMPNFAPVPKPVDVFFSGEVDVYELVAVGQTVDEIEDVVLPPAPEPCTVKPRLAAS
jgi:hypothetical protein